MNDERWMKRALELAQQAADGQEVPVGAVLVRDDQCIGEGFNQSITLKDPTAHAEIMAIRQASLAIDNYRLLNTTLYVTLEPCAMCAGALLHARIQRLVYGLTDPKMGAVHSKACVLQQGLYPHYMSVEFGLYADESLKLLQQFFKARR